MLHGNIGATTDLLFLVNGNVVGQVGLHSKVGDNDLALALGKAADTFERIAVIGIFLEREPITSSLPKFLVEQFALHDEIAQRAFAISQSEESGAPEQNWIRAEQELLGI